MMRSYQKYQLTSKDELLLEDIEELMAFSNDRCIEFHLSKDICDEFFALYYFVDSSYYEFAKYFDRSWPPEFEINQKSHIILDKKQQSEE